MTSANLGTDTSYLPADNQLKRWSFNGLLNHLPLSSSLALRYTSSESTSDVTLGTSQLIGAASAKSTAPFAASPGVFKGKINYDTWALTWSAAPAEKVDFWLYAYDFKRENKSSDVLFSGFTTATTSLGCVGVVGGTGPVGSATGPRICENEPFGYDRKNYGGEIAFRPTRANRISAGYDQLKTDREFHPDSDSTKEKRYSLEWRNTCSKPWWRASSSSASRGARTSSPRRCRTRCGASTSPTWTETSPSSGSITRPPRRPISDSSTTTRRASMKTRRPAAPRTTARKSTCWYRDPAYKATIGYLLAKYKF